MIEIPRIPKDSGRLADNIIYFARALRKAGMRVGPGTVMDAIRAAEASGIGSKQDFYWILHSVFVKRHEDMELFEQAFHIFWRKRALLERMMSQLMAPAPGDPQTNRDKVRDRVADALFAEPKTQPAKPKPQVDVDATFTMSDIELLQRKDFEQMSAAEIARAKAMMQKLILPFDKVQTRRLESAARGRYVDMRRTFRASFRAGGGLIDLKRMERARKTLPIVAICDISGSMTQYSRMFLHFLRALTEKRRRVESFVFGTRLSYITRQLRSRDPDEALEKCSDAVADWAGGTRIGTCLHDFNRLWSRRVLGQGAIVLLITDGLERDSEDVLGFELDRLQRSCRRLIWLNPLLRYEGFEAHAKGIVTMLSHVDEFRAVHNLNAIADLCEALDARNPVPADPKAWLKAA